jgi:prepilin-type N-terminal cleavage/methylation domain-containing protein
MMNTFSARTSPRRRGFTLVELLIVVVLFGIVSGTLIRVIARQQRFYRGATEMVDVRSQLRQATSLLPMDIRGLSSIDADIQSMSDSAMQFNANFGSGMACGITVASNQIDMPPKNANDNIYVSWTEQPAAGDSMFVFDDNVLNGSSDDIWRRYSVKTVQMSTTACDPSDYLDATTEKGLLKPRYRIVTNEAVSPTIRVGAVIRFARPARYSLYKAADNRWYLGYKDFRANSWSTIQPVSGPYQAFAAPGLGTTGISFKYYDYTGAQLNGNSAVIMARVARVDVSVRGQGDALRNVAISSGGQFRDSLVVQIAIRNRL